MMIISFDGYNLSILASGKRCSASELRRRYIKIINRHPQRLEDSIYFFCRVYGFEIIPFDESILPDYIVDTDTNTIFS